ncbi:MAG: four helix bundle protein [Planctomycetes bacterium]|nr:four helix bundle protein [Planctomycetota bacterium]
MSFKFEELMVYQKAMDFVNKVYLLTMDYPRDELFGLTSQLRRAAVSIALNVAEGSSRTKKDFCRFIDMARGSVFECMAILKISVKQSYVKQSELDDFESDLTEISKMLSGLKRTLN